MENLLQLINHGASVEMGAPFFQQRKSDVQSIDDSKTNTNISF